MINSKYQSFVIAVLISLVLFMPGQTSSKRTRIKVVVVKNFPPHYSVNSAGQPQGFAIDVMNAVAKRLGLSVDYIVKDNWTLTASALLNNEADMIPNLGISDKRKIDFDFSLPVEVFSISIVTRSDASHLNSIKDLAGKTVGVVKFNVGEKIARQYNNLTLKVYAQPEIALFALLSGEVSALIYPKSVMLHTARKSQLENRIRFSSKPIVEIKRAMAVKKGNAELLNRLNSAIKVFIYSKEYKAIYHKWYGEPRPFWTVTKIGITFSIAVIMIVIAAIIWRFWSVKTINRQLRDNIEDRMQIEQALRLSEQRFRTIFEQAALGVALIESTTGRFVRINRCYCDMVGYTVDELQESKSFQEITYPDDLEEDLNNMKGLMSGQFREFTMEKRYIHKSGSIVWVNLTVSATWAEGHKPDYHIAIVEDITMQKKAEQAKEEAEEALRRASKMNALGKLTGGIAHDYNNMLGVIIGYANLLRDQVTAKEDSCGPKMFDYIDQIVRAGKRSQEITAKLLGFSRNKIVNMEVVNVNQVIHNNLPMLEKTVTARIKLDVQLTDDIGLVKLDSGELENAIVNLMINAAYAIKESGVITIKTTNEHLDSQVMLNTELNSGDYVCLSIKDDGIGIDPDTKEQMFDPFFTTKGEQGIGMGLSQVYGFMHRCNGGIRVISAVGEGAEFMLYFPRLIDEVAEDKSQQTVDVYTGDFKGHETLLVVDDEQLNLALLKEILTSHGYKVLTASSGHKALEILSGNQVDLLLTDVIMPDVNGYELVNMAKQQNRNLKVQIMSGFQEVEDNQLVAEQLQQNTLQKPFTPYELLVQIRKSLRGTDMKNVFEGKTILVLDDDESVRDLFSLILTKLGCGCLLAENSQQAFSLCRRYAEQSETINCAIIDIKLNEAIKTNTILEEIKAVFPNIIAIVCSGDSYSDLMENPRQHGFDAAMEKTFSPEAIEEFLHNLFIK